MAAPELIILGSSSATPTRDRNPSAQVLKIGSQKIMIDCGEGTQMRLMQCGIRQSGLDYICISHLHGDHYFGLIGILSTLSLMGRKNPLHIIGPPNLREILEIQMLNGGRIPDFEVIYHVTNGEKAEEVISNPEFIISTFPLKHKIHCTGFLIRETLKDRHLNLKSIETHRVPMAYFKELKKGMDYTNDAGEVILNATLTYDPSPARSYAYCCDTIFDPEIVPYIKDCTVLYHEATYMEALIDKATARFHSTGRQAGIIAARANAKHLIIGHFSSRYDDLTPLLNETKAEFENTSLAIEGQRYLIEHPLPVELQPVIGLPNDRSLN